MKELLDAATKADELGQSFAVRISALEGLVSARAEKADADAQRFAKTNTGSDPAAREIVRRSAQETAKKDVATFRRTLLESSDKERVDRLRQLREVEEIAAKWEPLYESPQQLLSRAGLGSNERTQYTAQLRDSGPMELARMAKYAMTTKDRILGAAVLSRLDAMRSKDRPVAAQELARTLVGEEFDAVTTALRRIRETVQRAVVVNREFESGRTDSVAKIARGLAARRAQ